MTPATSEPLEAGPLEAGPFGSWLDHTRAVVQGRVVEAAVPCGSCTACCTSSQFVHIAPDETDALARIPAAVTFPAPGAPKGFRVMGYDERGHCPMFRDGACSIYEHRPRACRAYDCRVFAATGVDPGDDKPAVRDQVVRWRFTFESDSDRRNYEAIVAAARADPTPSPLDRAARALTANA